MQIEEYVIIGKREKTRLIIESSKLKECMLCC